MDLELNVGGYDCEEEGSDGKFRGVVVFKMWRKRSSPEFLVCQFGRNGFEPRLIVSEKDSTLIG